MWKRLAKGFGANMLGQIVLVVMQLSQVPVLAAHWGVERYGLWLMLTTVPTYLAISDLGFNKSSTIEMTMRIATGDRQGALRAYQSACLMIGIAAAVIGTVLVSICLMIPTSTFGVGAGSEEARTALVILVLYSVLALAGGFTSGPLQSTGHYALEAVCLAVMWAVEGSFVIVAALMGGGMVAAALGMILGRTFGVLLLYTQATRVAPDLRIGFSHARREEIARLVKPASAMMVMPLANSFMLQGTALAVGLAAAPAAVPAFTVTRTLSRLPMQLAGMLVRAAMPEFSAATARGDRVMQMRLLSISLLSSIVPIVPLALVLLFFGQTVIAVWTRGVVHVPIAVLVLLSISLFANGIWTPLSNLVIATNRQSTFAFWLLAMSAASLPVAYLIAIAAGPVGGAAAMMMVDCGMLVLMLAIVNRLFVPLGTLFAAMPESIASLAALSGKLRRRLRRH